MAPPYVGRGVIFLLKLFFTHDSRYAPWLAHTGRVSTTLLFGDQLAAVWPYGFVHLGPPLHRGLLHVPYHHHHLVNLAVEIYLPRCRTAEGHLDGSH